MLPIVATYIESSGTKLLISIICRRSSVSLQPAQNLRLPATHPIASGYILRAIGFKNYRVEHLSTILLNAPGRNDRFIHVKFMLTCDMKCLSTTSISCSLEGFGLAFTYCRQRKYDRMETSIM